MRSTFYKKDISLAANKETRDAIKPNNRNLAVIIFGFFIAMIKRNMVNASAPDI